MKKTLRYLSIPTFALGAMFLFGPTVSANHETTIQQCAESYNTRKDTGTDNMGNPITDEQNRNLFEACRDRVKGLKKGNK